MDKVKTEINEYLTEVQARELEWADLLYQHQNIVQLFAEDGEEPSPLDVRRCKRRETILILQLALAAIRETIGQRQELARDLAQVEHVYNRISARQILGKDAQKEALEMMTVTLFDFGELKGALDVYQSWVMRSTMEMREG